MRETKVEAYLHEQVEATRLGTTRKWVSPGHRGVPDRIVFWSTTPGRRGFSALDFVETKAPGKDAEAHQAREHERLARFGARVRVIDTKEKVDAYIREMLEWLEKSTPRVRTRR